MEESRPATRWCFTINNPTEEDIGLLVGTDADAPQAKLDACQYLIFQEERGKEDGTLHWQGFLILKKPQRLSWLRRNINGRAHWSIARECSAQCANYCKKSDTYTGGLRVERGKLPERAQAKKRSEMLEDAAEQLDLVKEGYKRPTEIPSLTLMQCGFMPAYKALVADVLGPYRPDLKILTLIGRPGVGKSFAIQKYFPEHGRAIYGNNGCWFQNPTSDVMVFEEFCGQIPLQRMLQILDPYPLALEVKGSMAPALFTKVIITSNTPPSDWYKGDEAGVPGKRTDSIKALWDRLGYSNGVYIPVRKTGTYLQDPMIELETTRAYFDHHVHLWATNQEQDVEDISDEEGCPAATAAADLNAQD